MAIHKENAVNMDAVPHEGKPSTGENRIGKFLREVRIELQKTDWPSKNELTKFTVVVMVTIVAVAAFLFVSDLIAQGIMHFFGITPREVGL